MENEANHPVKTTEKTLSIVEALRDGREVGVTELADELDMTKSAVHNHLNTLEQHGYVTKEDSRYSLSLKFLGIGGSLRSRMEVFRVAEPEINRLAQKSGELCNLLVEEDGMGVYLYREKGTDAVDLTTYAGLRVHLHSTALGKAILAHLPRQRVDGIVDRHGLPATTESTITDRDELFEELDRARERGYAVDDEELVEGLRCVAAPIIYQSEVKGAISISAPTTRFDDEWEDDEFIDYVCSSANVIQLNLEYESTG